jgi:hypothetical protein
MSSTFMDWLYVQMVAINAHIKLCGEDPEGDYINTPEYAFGYRDAIKRAIKFYKTMAKEME